MSSRPPRFLLVLVFLLGLGGAPLLAQREKLPPDDLEIVEKKWPNAKRTYTGLRYLVLQPGDQKGPTPVPGNFVSVAYKGMLLNGTVFDEADADKPLHIRVGRGNLIYGWEEAIQKMHKGEKWILIVPSELGYGVRGRAPTIPRDATLVFEMELVDFGTE
ncbi:MAG TPA: FKBP-type peptidyl-prolyl cis-trans isomerase [Lacunisphaera sp.]|nr:FKBP-type peptidyl-prolyl cis-trans isomerase [Lacunisphaera sp.]